MQAELWGKKIKSSELHIKFYIFFQFYRSCYNFEHMESWLEIQETNHNDYDEQYDMDTVDIKYTVMVDTVEPKVDD